MKRLKKFRSRIGRALVSTALAVIYIVAVFPAGLLMRLIGRDRLTLKRRESGTYWKKSDIKKGGYEFRF